MSETASYVINWEELIENLSDKIIVNVNGDIQVDFGPLRTILERYLPEIRTLIEALLGERYKPGKPRIKGLSDHVSGVTNKTNDLTVQGANIALTGLTYWQSRFSSRDHYSLSMTSGAAKIVILDRLYAKDTVQHKRIDPPVPVPAGYRVVLETHTEGEKDLAVDFEYQELDAV